LALAPRGRTQLAALLAVGLEDRRSIDAQAPSYSNHDSLALKDDGEPPNVEAPSLDRKRGKTLAELIVIAHDAELANHAVICADVPACRAFADVESGKDRCDAIP
jgi:hypothetical protein